MSSPRRDAMSSPPVSAQAQDVRELHRGYIKDAGVIPPDLPKQPEYVWTAKGVADPIAAGRFSLLRRQTTRARVEQRPERVHILV